ncbi:hypothetical protein DNTS_014995 [Danionella cerebrum]|uniref:Sushi repeat-containing protein SRPX2 n=1 Tax=Danionella cerebrum TaxID=2873325 RepID=A0A553QFT4_9TELE|nr:hypothetical protein DNTS_014995 [Danionella translucida]
MYDNNDTIIDVLFQAQDILTMIPMRLCTRMRLTTHLSWITNIHSGVTDSSSAMEKCPVLHPEVDTIRAHLELAACFPVIMGTSGWASHQCTACPIAAGLDLPSAGMFIDSRQSSSIKREPKTRCRVLPLIDHGMYSCSRGLVVDSRCDYSCYEGYEMEGDQYRMCQEDGKWSGREPTCADREPPKLKCPLSREKLAEPGKLTVMVTWERPVARDTADRALRYCVRIMLNVKFSPRSTHVIRYKAYDQAGNMATCKFTLHVEVRRCPRLQAPVHGSLSCSSDDNNYGAVCEYHCDPGFERTGFATRVCQLNRSWSDEAAQCLLMDINTDVRSAGALLDQFYEKRRLLVVSTPDNGNQKYRLQNIMLQNAVCGLDLRHVTVIELLGTAPRAVGRIKEQRLQPEVIEGLR